MLFEIDDSEDNKKYLLQFYHLLVEMFEYWGTDPDFSGFEKLKAKFKALEKTKIVFNGSEKYLLRY